MLVADYFYDPPNENFDKEFKGNLSVAYAYGAHGVEVEVDKETGQVRSSNTLPRTMWARLNPMLLEGQIYGGGVMGLGYALSENMVYQNGKIMNPNFLDYKLLTAKDIPPIEAVISRRMRRTARLAPRASVNRVSSRQRLR